MAVPTIEKQVTVSANGDASSDASTLSRSPDVIGRTAPDFLKRFVGIHANSPLFDTVVREIENERERQRQDAQLQGDTEELMAEAA